MKAQYIEITDLGNKFYFSDKNMLIHHREDGPAIEWDDGDKEWWINDERHREDGPAIEMQNGCKKWWFLNDIEYSEEEFNKKMNRAKTISINGREFTIEELNSLIATAKK